MTSISNHSLGKHHSTLKLYFEIRLLLGSLTNEEALYPCGCASRLKQGTVHNSSLCADRLGIFI